MTVATRFVREMNDGVEFAISILSLEFQLLPSNSRPLSVFLGSWVDTMVPIPPEEAEDVEVLHAPEPTRSRDMKRVQAIDVV